MPDDGLSRAGSRRVRANPPHAVGAFAIRATSNELAGPQGVIRLRPRLMDVLLRLAASPGEVVERQRLLDDVWPRRLVADEVLSRTIAELRTVLGDDAREATYIETIPKVGYRLIAPVTPDEPAGSTRHVAASPSPATLHRPLALRPSLLIGAATSLALIAGVALFVSMRGPGLRDEMRGRVRNQLETAQPFSSDLAMETGAHFAPDGNRVVFALGDTQRTELVVQDVRTRTRTVVGVPPGLNQNPVFFADGRRIAYWRSDCVIAERELQSGAERELVPCTRKPLARFDLSHDGRTLVYATLRDGAPGLRLVDLRSGAIRELTTPPAEVGDDREPRFSPDGRTVAFLRGHLADRAVWIVPVAEPDKARAIGTRRGVSWGLAWLGNQGPLLVSADWFGFRALNLVDLATGNESLAGARGAQFPDAAANGDLVYESASYQSNLWLVSDGSRKPVQLWPSTRYTNYPEFSPDGQRIVFSSNRDNASSLFIGSVGGESRRLPLHAGSMYVNPHWSYDGRFLYAARVQGDGDARTATAVRIDTESAAVESLDALGDMVAEIHDADEGRMLYYGDWENGILRLWRVPANALDRREALPLPRVEEFAVRGNRLAYRASRSHDIATCALPQLSCATVQLPPTLQPRSGWALGNDALWIGVSGEPGTVARFDLGTQSVTRTLPYAPSAIGPNVAVSPDEHSIVVARQEPPAIDLMIARHAP